MLPDNGPRRAFVGLAQGSVALKGRAVIGGITARVRAIRVPLLHRALRVVDELINDAPLLSCPPAVGGHGVQRGERGGIAGSAEGLLGNGGCAVLDEVSGHACRCLLGSQAIAGRFCE